MRVIHKDASCYISIWKGEVFISSLVTKQQGRKKGYATGLLKKLKKYADIYNLKLELYASRYDYGAAEGEILPQDKLIEFYKKNGFTRVDNDERPKMRYVAKRLRGL